MKKLFGFMALGMALALMPMGASATSIVPKCDKSCPTEEGKCTSTCKITIEENTSSLTSFTATLEIAGDGVSVTSFTGGDGWTVVTPQINGNLTEKSIPVSLIATTAITDSNFTLATFTLELESSATDCSIKIANPSTGSEKTIEIEKTTETKTGASLPIAIIGCGLVGAVVIYSVTKKNKKMYKI